MNVTKFNYISDNYYEYRLNNGAHHSFVNKHNRLNAYYKLFSNDNSFMPLDRHISIYLHHMEFYTL